MRLFYTLLIGLLLLPIQAYGKENTENWPSKDNGAVFISRTGWYELMNTPTEAISSLNSEMRATYSKISKLLKTYCTGWQEGDKRVIPEEALKPFYYDHTTLPFISGLYHDGFCVEKNWDKAEKIMFQQIMLHITQSLGSARIFDNDNGIYTFINYSYPNFKDIRLFYKATLDFKDLFTGKKDSELYYTNLRYGKNGFVPFKYGALYILESEYYRQAKLSLFKRVINLYYDYDFWKESNKEAPHITQSYNFFMVSYINLVKTALKYHKNKNANNVFKCLTIEWVDPNQINSIDFGATFTMTFGEGRRMNYAEAILYYYHLLDAANIPYTPRKLNYEKTPQLIKEFDQFINEAKAENKKRPKEPFFDVLKFSFLEDYFYQALPQPSKKCHEQLFLSQ